MIEINLNTASLLDVRTREEFINENYPGSVNVPLDEILFNIDEISALEKPVLVYCRSGNRSKMAVHLLSQSGITEVYDAGGLDDIIKLKNTHV